MSFFKQKYPFVIFPLLVVYAIFLITPKKSIYFIISNLNYSFSLDEMPGLDESYLKLDNYFAVKKIDDMTLAIYEPRYFQRNVSYLILGDNTALLFDTGSGNGDIKKVVAQFTNLPTIALVSHLHYDHMGGIKDFSDLRMIDEESIKTKLVDKNSFKIENSTHLGKIENREFDIIDFNKWIRHEQVIDLGGRKIQVLHTKGHSPSSIMLLDQDRKYLFVGDFLNDSFVTFALLGNSMKQTFSSARILLDLLPKDIKIFPAHRLSVREYLTYIDLQDFYISLKTIIEENSIFSKLRMYYKVNEYINIYLPLSDEEQ